MKSICILLPCPPPTPNKAWGDWYFGNSLGKAFERLGIQTKYMFQHKKKKYQYFEGLKRHLARNEADFVLRGKLAYKPIRGKPFFIWVISQSSSLTDVELKQASHIFVASEFLANKWSKRGLPVTFVPQCTDAHIFSPDRRRTELATDVLFVGNRRSYAERPVVQMALDCNANLTVWGRDWHGRLEKDIHKGEMIENSELGHHYASANVVINDHTDDMLETGLVSNRIYDVLACGTAIVTEKMDSIPDDIKSGLYLYEDLKSFRQSLQDAQDKSQQKQKMRLELANHIRQHHTFDTRAQVMLNIMKEVVSEKI
ncbi:glycosyltransferase family protein [Parasulfitobacter algicola]|uniref:Glycosyltransferase family 1 protein n=1 Tax=Parasulfitobacter algicola TaxID=2614809 RepID=A0ABX2IS49_9RHOB|nr:glycosyltransferase [Sulfitobacter algicola]NSX53184.1 glycosyltransferase family 1 protein [Sulfitobacter algicola]